ncbi:MAG TPA: ATP-binding protein, partial [Candidatus Paceibacterota bacterium]|nr:ATP-binding protein [Candidatus Paceibacterota bacterium]
LNHYSRKDDLPLTNCDIHFIIDNCLLMIQNQIKNRIEIIKDYTHKPYQLISGESKLHQVILNILINAAQAIKDKGTIKINTKIENNTLEIIISDTGCGIPEENIDKILDPFFTTKEPGKGTGLGLSITYNILQEINGNISFKSKKEKGTTVTIKLPLTKTR